MENKRYHYLYKTTNLINGDYYYGMHSTYNLNDNYLGSGKRLKYSINKYGKDNFKREIIQMYDTKKELIQGEIELITENIVKDSKCLNLKPGGDGGLGNMILVRDKHNNYSLVHKDDERYLNKELVTEGTNKVLILDKEGKTHRIDKIDKNDERYLSGELISFFKDKFVVKDKNNINYFINRNDEKYLSGELCSIHKNTLTVKDKDNNKFKVSINDERYISGELVCIWKNKKHKQETKDKIGRTNSIKQKGENNSNFGKCWITKDDTNKSIKTELLEDYIKDGWIKGRKCKKLK
jgi:hypothetical protein